MTAWRLDDHIKKTEKKEPRYIACHFLPHSVVPLAEHLQDAYRCAKLRNQWLTLPYRKLKGGSKDGQCWFNVKKAIDVWSGSMQCGWAFRIDPTDNNKNCMEDIEAIPHGVWRSPEDELIEVSADCKESLFYPSDVVVPMLMINVGFVDSVFFASTYRPTNPLQPYGNKYIATPKGN